MAVISASFRERYYYRLIYDAIVFSRSAALAKWAQWASIRLDLLPATLCELLAELQANAPTHSLMHTISELEKSGLQVAYGSGPAAPGAISSLEASALASGSIAQVHLARRDGEVIVVKIRHPRVAETMLLDFEILLRFANVLHTCLPPLRWLNAPGTVAQFEAAMAGQTDLEQEGRHLELFAHNFRRKSSWISFPKVLFSSEAVLVESFEAGEMVAEFVKQGLAVERSEAHFLIARGEDAYLQMLLMDNFMHADLHPGNMLFRKRGLLGKPQLVLVDGGMAARLTGDERRNFIGLLQAIGDGDGAVLADRVLTFSAKPGAERNDDGFRTDIRNMCAEKCRGYGTGMDLGGVLREMMQLMFRHGVSVDGNYATLIANMMCLEGLATQLEPRFNLMDTAYPLLRGHQLLGDAMFQRFYRSAQWAVPKSVWEMFHVVALYAAFNGEFLKRFQF